MPQTLQTPAPLEHRSLQASSRQAREVARMMTELGDLSPAYQRGAVWSREQRMGLIRSWMLGLPIPAVIINDRIAAGWPEGARGLPAGGHAYAMVDGKQRIETAIAWFDNSLAVPASWFGEDAVESSVPTDDGLYVTYDGLSLPAQRHFTNRALIPVVEAREKSLQDEAAIYLLVNGAGVAQTDTDLDNARRVAGQ